MDAPAAWQDVLDNTGLVKWNVEKFLRRRFDNQMPFEFDDLLTAAYIGCFNAAMAYDPDRGFTKGTFYSTCIVNALRQETDKLRRGAKGQIHSNCGDLEPDLTESTQGADPAVLTGIWGLAKKLREQAEDESFEDALVVQLDHIAVREAVNSLDPQARQAVIDHYWNGQSFREMGENRGISRQAVEQRFDKVKAQLRVALAPVVAA